VVLRAVIAWLVQNLETLGGARGVQSSTRRGWILRGLWWAILFTIAYLTIGRNTKFIYVDF
jgi:hypothetical protein